MDQGVSAHTSPCQEAPDIPQGEADVADTRPQTWIEQLRLTDFRNHSAFTVTCGPEPVVLIGENGAGKTNILEAVSLLAPGQGLRRAVYTDLCRRGGGGGWAISARINTSDGQRQIGTGIAPGNANEQRGRAVRIDGEAQASSGALADFVDMVWLTPALDSLFTGPASERRRFLDRLVAAYDPEHRVQAGLFERAMRQRNRLLEQGDQREREFAGLESILSQSGVAIAAARLSVISELERAIATRRERAQDSPFPWSAIALEGSLETALARSAAIDVEDWYARELARLRERDRAAGRTTQGPHRSDFVIAHGPKSMPARLCSTGEQKALLVGLVLAHAEMLVKLSATRGFGARSRGAPILLLDEISAHLDAQRRAALFADILAIGSQAWMTGTDRSAFSALEGRATFVDVG